MKRIIDLIRMKEVEGVVKERWGGPACRIFRLLLVKRQLEQKQIAEMAMLPMKVPQMSPQPRSPSRFPVSRWIVVSSFCGLKGPCG